MPQIEKSTLLVGPLAPGVSFFSSEPSTTFLSGGVVEGFSPGFSAGASTVSIWPASAPDGPMAQSPSGLRMHWPD
jgi:hypothetical protein